MDEGQGEQRNDKHYRCHRRYDSNLGCMVARMPKHMYTIGSATAWFTCSCVWITLPVVPWPCRVHVLYLCAATAYRHDAIKQFAIVNVPVGLYTPSAMNTWRWTCTFAGANEIYKNRTWQFWRGALRLNYFRTLILPGAHKLWKLMRPLSNCDAEPFMCFISGHVFWVPQSVCNVINA